MKNPNKIINLFNSNKLIEFSSIFLIKSNEKTIELNEICFRKLESFWFISRILLILSKQIEIILTMKSFSFFSFKFKLLKSKLIRKEFFSFVFIILFLLLIILLFLLLILLLFSIFSKFLKK